ncbi:hypothetical protein [Methylobacterium sp. J-092]|uniref:hypothetical protein n=1 Tax=Methylobacterium sp. J-092 TaxID=2836667 RepID=UPI001FBB8447|nr:hypothetical protein [Methylobacterium sp. J-092]MCJ2007569.1 hypothetical protein [Methylobacterium sp. J-092]
MKKPDAHLSIARASLERIAQTLDEPVSTFFTGGEPESREVETLALVRAFDRIRDPQARARCLTFVTAEADRS